MEDGRKIDVPDGVVKLFFRFPWQIIVEERLADGTSISVFEQTSKKYFWDRDRRL